MTDDAITEGYIPGVCNINRAEIAYRRKWAYIGAVSFLAIAAILIALGISRWSRITLFIPAFISVINFLQTKNKFCVTYAAAGQQNATEGSAKAQSVTDKKAQQKDKSKARTMNMQAAIIAIVITVLAVAV